MSTRPLQKGDVLDYTAGAAVAVNEIVRIGKKSLGVALVAAAASGDVISVGVAGAYSIPKAAVAIAIGDRVFVTIGTAPAATNVCAAGLYFFGFATRAAASGDALVEVELCEFVDEGERVLTINAAATLSIADLLSGSLTVLSSTAGGAFTITLPAIATVSIGQAINSALVTAGAALTWDGNASETVAGGATYASQDAAGDYLSVVSNGTAWIKRLAVIA